ncbi:O-acetyltransferase OatA [Novipirellula galeiformis]|uniref:O-acetyltransferase OatA n=1 Tax=Novipirellula galeiformis TaxID=2528004 RepID=A0A5C6CRR5_9BACT|nr:O-acetyltransferase OatA [Novipirellula galeiformis]
MGIDILRGLAVLAVVLCHIPHYAIGGFRENIWFFPSLLMDFGYLGVPLFVLISGFCIHRRTAITRATSGKCSLNWVEFWKRRFWRLYPPYVAAIVLSVSFALLIHERMPDLANSIGPDLATHLLMVHNLTADYAGGLGNTPFWSLGMEEQLYAFYFLLFLMIRIRNHTVAISVAAITTIIWRGATPGLPDAYGLGYWQLWPFNFWLHWALGALAVDAYFGNCRLPRWCSSMTYGLLAATAGMLTNRLTFGFLAQTRLAELVDMDSWSGWIPNVSSVGELGFAVAFFCFLNWCVQAKDHVLLRNSLATGISCIGKISYSVYLIHVPVIFVLEKYIPFEHSQTEWILRMLIYAPICLIAGAMFYWLVERWFLAGHCPPLWRSTKPAANALS